MFGNEPPGSSPVRVVGSVPTATVDNKGDWDLPDWPSGSCSGRDQHHVDFSNVQILFSCAGMLALENG